MVCLKVPQCRSSLTFASSGDTGALRRHNRLNKAILPPLSSKSQRGMSHRRPKQICRGSVEVSPSTPQRIGVLGGGQLGKMLGIAAARMGINLKVLDPTENCPAASVAGHVVGDFSDAETVRSFVTDEDVLTVEIEHVDAAAMRDVRDSASIDVEPTPETLEIIQDKFKQKEHFNHKAGIKVTSYIDVEGEGTGDLAMMVLGLPFMLKSKRWAYDGRGNMVVKKLSELEDAAKALGGYEKGLYGEKWVEFTKEVAVMVAKTKDGQLSSFPVTETIHKDSILHVTQTPAQIPEELLQKAIELAEKAVASLEGAGIFGVEMFVMKGGELALNEVAPRPHNSGHYTIEACCTSQFEQHLRAISGLPLGDASLKVKNSVMLNILGEDEGDAGVEKARSLLDKAYGVQGASVHWYGKKGVSKKRKIGHITIVADSSEQAAQRLSELDPEAAKALQETAEAFDEDWQKVLKAREKEAEEGGSGGSGPPVLAVSVERASDYASNPISDAKTGPKNQDSRMNLKLGRAAESSADIARQNLGLEGSASPLVSEESNNEFTGFPSSRHRVNAASVEQASSSGNPEVAIIMGSDSDLPTMQAAADVLSEFGINREVTIVSAHRTPDRMLDFARGAHKRGIKVIIAGAGGAAHLPGMVASLTPLPVIGVPVTPKGAHLDGLDALMSIVQMPKGVPVATVAIGNAANAGLLAARILATSDEALLNKMLSYQENMKKTVLEKAAKLEASAL